MSSQVLVLRGQAQLLAQVLRLLVNGKSGTRRRQLEEDAARLAEVDAQEVLAVDDRGHPPACSRPCPPGSRHLNARPPSATWATTPARARRWAQNSSAAREPTRQRSRWIMPAPARPGGASGNSKKVRIDPGAPRSSP